MNLEPENETFREREPVRPSGERWPEPKEDLEPGRPLSGEYVPTRSEKWQEAKRFVGPVFAALLVLLLLAWLLMMHALPAWKSAQERSTRAPALREEFNLLRLEAKAWKLAEAREEKEQITSPERVDELGSIIRRSRELLKRWPDPDADARSTIAALESVENTAKARIVLGKSAEAERRAQLAQKAANYKEFATALGEALKLQGEANRLLPQESERDLVREAELEARLKEAEASALQRMAAEARREAAAAATTGQAAGVVRALQTERSLLEKLSQQFQGTGLDPAAELTELDEKIATAQAFELNRDVEEALETAKRALAQGQNVAAGDAFATAAERQRKLNAQFPKSRLAQTSRAEEFEISRQTALASPHQARATDLLGKATSLIRSGNFGEAKSAITEAKAALSQVTRQYPQARNYNLLLQTQLEYLGLKQDALKAVAAEVLPLMVGLSTEKLKLWVYPTEVPQALYTKIMNFNPSHTLAENLPVDSVTWPEVLQFCQRLSWLLGRRVRPLSKSEFVMMIPKDGEAWLADSAHGRPHLVGTSRPSSLRLYDIIGNLAEWVKGGEVESAVVPVAGGNFTNTQEDVAAHIFVLVEANFRSRYIGFRFAIE